MIRLLNIDKFYTCCDSEIFNFKTTAELETLDKIIGQNRAPKSIGIGIDIKENNFLLRNIII